MNTLKNMLLFIVLAVFTASCENPTEPKDPECKISISSENIELESGNSTKISISTYECSDNIEWKSNNSNIASVKKINQDSAKITAESEGSTSIRAFAEKNNASATANISVSFNPMVTYTIGGVNIAAANKFGSEKKITDANQQEIYPDWIGSNELAYIYVPDGILYSINLDGSNKQVISDEFDNLISFDISKDNSKLLVSGNPNDSELTEIYTKDLNEGSITRLTFEGNEAGRIPGFPYWSPDGKKIAFQTHRDGNWEIYTMNADGSNQQNITNTPNQHETKPSWSNDGEKITFVSGPEGEMNTIEVIDTDGSNRSKVTNGIYPSWTNENKIVFTSNGKVSAINPDGSDKQVIVDSPGKRYTPSWKPEN